MEGQGLEEGGLEGEEEVKEEDGEERKEVGLQQEGWSQSRRGRGHLVMRLRLLLFQQIRWKN